jgi:catechol 2,3-dioxygenase-like lactoylglutathione lyase family enzyme
VRFTRVRLNAPQQRRRELADFYGSRLGLSMASSSGEPSFQIGETTLDFVAGPGAAFYHFALLVPGNRFDAALAWANERTTLLPEPRTGEVVFDFDFWDANACYFEDPAGNIVELIAHRGIDGTDADGPFLAAELTGLSELGLVGDLPEMAESLARLGLHGWAGSADPSGGLAFVGEQARTLILAARGRGWLPTGRAAEVHDVDVLLSARPAGEVLLESSRYRIRQSGG